MTRTIALIGAGDVAKFFVEEMLAAGHRTIVLSRAIRSWFDRPDVTLLISDYSADSFQSSFDEYSVEAVFCFIHDNTPSYNVIHENILKACAASKTAKRFVPSEYDGDIDSHWDKPRFHLDTHVPFRKVLASQTAVEYTLLNPGWFMDYVVPADRTYMKNIYPVWPVDINGESEAVIIPGTGEESIGLTSARDIARVAVHLLQLSKWPEKTYVCGQYTTWNKLVEQLGRFYGRQFKITYKPISEVERVMNDPASSRESRDFAYMEEWNHSGASAPPQEHLLSGIHLRSVQELLDDSQHGGIV